MSRQHFLTTAFLGVAVFLLGADPNLLGGQGAYGGLGFGGTYSGGGSASFGGGYGSGLGSSGFYGGRLFYGDYITGGGYPGYFTYPYANRSYSYAAPSIPYSGPGAYPIAPITFFYVDPSPSSNAPAPKPARATIRLVLPDPDATVVFDGHATTSTGSERSYRTPELMPGKRYHYQLRVTWMQDGHPVTQERTAEVEAGRMTEIVFTRTVSPAISTAK